MTVFKTFLKILNSCKGTVILYTVILVIFGGMNMKTSDNSTNFVASKPDVFIVNSDDSDLTDDLIKYIGKKSEIKDIENTKEAQNDALFYREVNYIIYIPENFGADLIDGKNPEIEVKSTGDYQAYYAELLLERYVKTAINYIDVLKESSGDIDEAELIKKINSTVEKETQIEVTSKLDTDKLGGATFYFNFMNYGLLAGAIFSICMVLASFREEKIRRRTIISSMKKEKHNSILLMGNIMFALVLWAAYTLVGFFMCGFDVLMSKQGLVYIINSFVFTISAVSFAFLLANLVSNKNALNGIVTVFSLGTSFLCGAFVPAEWLPDVVLKIAHIFPSYWYIQNNEAVKTLEQWNFESIKPLIINMVVMLGFSIVFIIAANIVSARKKESR